MGGPEPTHTESNHEKRDRHFADEQAKLVNYLLGPGRELQATVKDVLPVRFQFKAPPDKWSVADCLQHLALK